MKNTQYIIKQCIYIISFEEIKVPHELVNIAKNKLSYDKKKQQGYLANAFFFFLVVF